MSLVHMSTVFSATQGTQRVLEFLSRYRSHPGTTYMTSISGRLLGGWDLVRIVGGARGNTAVFLDGLFILNGELQANYNKAVGGTSKEPGQSGANENKKKCNRLFWVLSNTLNVQYKNHHQELHKQSYLQQHLYTFSAFQVLYGLSLLSLKTHNCISAI